MFLTGWQVTETATTSQNAPYSHCQARHTRQGGKEQPWGDTHPNTQTMNTKPAHTKNAQKIFPLTKARADDHSQDVDLEWDVAIPNGRDVGLDWDNFRHAETELGCKGWSSWT